MVNRLKILHIDNDAVDLKRLSTLLQQNDVVDIELHQVRSYLQAIEVLRLDVFHATIIDYKLGRQKTCFDVIKAANSNNMGIVVITSGTEEGKFEDSLSIKGEWLSKPYNQDKINKLLSTLKKRLFEYDKTLTIYSHKRILKLPYSNILFIEASRNTPSIVIVDENMKPEFVTAINTTLEKIYAQLDHSVFQQSQKSYLVNVTKILGCIPKDNTLLFGISPGFPKAQFSYNYPDFIKLLELKGFL